MLHDELVRDLREGEEEWSKDRRDLMVAPAPYHDCARRLDLDVAATFRDAAASGPESLREIVAAFGARDDVALSAFGFTMVQGPAGASYRFESPS